ncbi:MAG: T9SS type A sorting domain-containing protein [Bacteroidia bacterium]
MMTLIRNLILFLAALCFMQVSWSQTSTPTPSIALGIDAITNKKIQLSWTTPDSVVSCDIVYSTHYNTSIYPISNFGADSVILSRNIPVGPKEKFVIRFVKPSGDTITDSEILINIYGGIVLIAEDVFAQTIVDMCNGDPEGISQLYLLNECLVAPIEQVCDISSDYMANQNLGVGINSSDVTDPLAYVDNMVAALQNGIGDPSTGIYLCDDLVTDTLTGVTVDGLVATSTVINYARQAKSIAQKKPFIQLSPNPCIDRLQIRFEAIRGVESAEIIIRNMHGKVVYQGNHALENNQELISLNTSNWATGAYIISIITNGDQENMKILKY